jgi:hypothetical protein
MKADDQDAGFGGKWAVVIVSALLLAFALFGLTRLRSCRSSLITLDATGTTRLGPVPLGNTNVRDAVFSTVSRLNNGAVSVNTADSTPMSNLVETFRAMQQAGLTSVTIRVDTPTASDGTTRK